MSKQFGFALFGVGRAGTIHVKNLLSNHRARLFYLVEADVSKAQAILETHHAAGVKVIHIDDAKKVFADESVHAVVVCTPTPEHEPIIREALENGKAVFSEKPISQTLNGIKSCYETSRKNKMPLYCSFNRRFDPTTQKLKKLVSEGKIGDVQVVKNSSRDNPFPPLEYLRTSGGLFHDSVVHDFDIICWLLGERPKSVSCMAYTHCGSIKKMGNDYDTAITTLIFPSGILAVIDNSRHAVYGYDQRVELFGTKGMMILNNRKDTELTQHLENGTVEDLIDFSFPQRYHFGYIASLEHFLNALEGKEELIVKEVEVMNCSIIATACEKSVETGRRIDFTEDDNGLLHPIYVSRDA